MMFLIPWCDLIFNIIYLFLLECINVEYNFMWFVCTGLERVHGFTFGDSLDENSRSKWIDFKARLNKVTRDYFMRVGFNFSIYVYYIILFIRLLLQFFIFILYTMFCGWLGKEGRGAIHNFRHCIFFCISKIILSLFLVLF